MVGLDKRWLAAHGLDANCIAGLIPFSGQAITHFTIRNERGIGAKQPVLDDMAPLYHVRKDAPPLLLITGDREFVREAAAIVTLRKYVCARGSDVMLPRHPQRTGGPSGDTRA